MHKKIAFIAYQSSIAGGEEILIRLAHAARDAGWETVIAIPEHGEIEKRLFGCRVEIVPMRSSIHPSTILNLRKFFKKEAPLIVHSHGMLRNLPSRIARYGIKNLALINTVHMSRNLAHGGQINSFTNRLRNEAYRFYDNISARFADSIVAVGNSVQDDLLAQGLIHPRLLVIRNGVDVNCETTKAAARKKLCDEFNIPQNSFIVGSLNRFSVQKDIPTLMETALMTIRRNDKAHFIVFGNGELSSYAKQRVDSEQASDKIILAGYRHDAKSLLPGLDTFLLTSRWEGLPLAIIEAFAADIPAVATTNPGNAEALDELVKTLGAPIGNVQALSNIIIKLIESKELRKKCSLIGQKIYHEKFQVKQMCDKYLDLYNKMHKDVIDQNIF